MKTRLSRREVVDLEYQNDRRIVLKNSEVQHVPDQTKLLYLFLFGIFIVSGAAGLIYEVVWVRQLTKVLGASSYAVSIVLVAFMGGLGLGAWLLGKTADRLTETWLVRVYVILEVAIGCYALFFSTLLKGAEAVYIGFYQQFSPDLFSFHLFKLGMAFLLLVIPTTLMGATFPIMSRYLVRVQRTASIGISRLYAANTIGAIGGTLAAGYLLLPSLGIYLTTLGGIFLNLTAALGMFCFQLLVKGGDSVFADTQVIVRRVPQNDGMTFFQWSIALGFGVSGAAAMFYQVAWTRTLSMILGTTSFAFTTMLATFLTGIALGSASYSLWPKTISRGKLFVFFQLLAGFAALLTIPLFEKLPILYLSLYGTWVTTWLDMQGLRFLLAALVMLVPTFALGATLPVVTSLLIDNLGQLGQRVGKAYALNTLGAVVGAATAGLVLIPLVGMQQTLIFGALMNLLVGLGVIFMINEITIFRRTATVMSACLLASVTVFLIQPWAPRIINSGVYLYAGQYQEMEERFRALEAAEGEDSGLSTWDIWEMSMKQYDLLYYKAGVTATVAVMENRDGVRSLTIDGKTDASSGLKSDMRTQVMIGQLPLLFHPKPEKVLVVGLGSGVTAGSVLTHDIGLVDVAEISPGVIEAAEYFSEVNHNALEDPRLHIIPRDARNFLLTEDVKYDVVISQPSNPWVKGEASLFTEEWYRLVKTHLENGGLFVQWVPSYLMADRDLKIIAHTLRTVFPHLTVWRSGSVGDLVFLAHKGANLQIDMPGYLQKIGNGRVAMDIARVGLDPREILLAQFIMGEKDLIPYLYADLKKPLKKNTDDWSSIEFSTPKQLIGGNNVSRFVDPKNRHFNVDALLKVISSDNREDFQGYLHTIMQDWDRKLVEKIEEKES